MHLRRLHLHPPHLLNLPPALSLPHRSLDSRLPSLPLDLLLVLTRLLVELPSQLKARRSLHDCLALVDHLVLDLQDCRALADEVAQDTVCGLLAGRVAHHARHCLGRA